MRGNDYSIQAAGWDSSIRGWFAAADETARAAGAEWYKTAAGSLRPYTIRGGGVWTREQAAAVCAVLSPRITWKENLAGVHKMHSAARAGGRLAPVVAGVSHNRIKAWEIAQTGDLALVSGPKVSSFYANLCGDFQRVTLDVWAARAAGLSESEMSHIDRARYVHLEQAYQRVAAEVGYLPAELQAAVWVAIRGRAN